MGHKAKHLGDLSFVSLGFCHTEVHRLQLKYLEIETSLQCKILELFIAEICETLLIVFFFFLCSQVIRCFNYYQSARAGTWTVQCNSSLLPLIPKQVFSAGTGA